MVEATVKKWRDYLTEKITNPNTPQNMRTNYEQQLATLEEKEFQRVIKIIDN